MTFNVDTGFSNGVRLQNVREDVLNPIAKRVADLRSRVSEIEKVTDKALVDVEVKKDEKKLVFSGPSPAVEADLTGMFREGSDLALVDKSGGKIPDISEISFHDSTITNQGTGKAEISYDWDKLVTTHQEKMAVGKFGQPATQKPSTLVFRGPSTSVDHSGDITTVTIPEAAEFKGAIGTGTAQTIEEVRLIGNTSNSSFSGTTLQIHIPDGGGGGGGGITNQNFKGFFESLGDIQSQVTDAISGKSYAFAKDSKLGGSYYTPYFYVNNSWTELKQDPALTYSGPSEAQVHGVFSIKPDSRIKVDNNGQVDLSGLGTDEYFVGFYETQEALESAVPNPILDKSFAFVKVNTTGAWVARYYTHTKDGNAWLKIAPQGAMPLVEFNSDGSAKLMQNFYGVKQNSKISVDTSGLLTFDDSGNAAIKVAIKGKSGTEEGEAETLEFEAGKSYATLSDKKLILTHPQRVIQYDSAFESSHNSMDYEGNIYYDESSRCWMGWGVPEIAGGVDKKWTKIAHPKMSEEVRDLIKRLPVKAPYIDPGVLGDAAGWAYTGWSYVRRDDNQLPDDFKSRCGAYISTIIQDVPDDTARPKERLQICYADEQGGHCYVRTWNKGVSEGAADYGWRPWVKISMSAKDISDHNTSHTAHRDIFRFYKVGTIDMSWASLKAKLGKIGDKDLLLLADSDGVSVDGSDTINVPYTGSYRFSGRIDFDGLTATSSVYPKPQFILYVYKTVNSVSSIISEHAYTHADQTKPVPPLQWKSGEIQLNEGDKIHFELKEFKNVLDSISGLRFIPNRNFFIMEDFRTTAGSRIAETFRRTLGSLNAHYNVGVNVHYNSGDAGPIRVYGAAVTAKATDMSKIKG